MLSLTPTLSDAFILIWGWCAIELNFFSKATREWKVKPIRMKGDGLKRRGSAVDPKCRCSTYYISLYILRISKFSSISSSIRDELHWLPVRSRIVFKHCLLVLCCIAGSAPSHLAELCVSVCSRPPKVPSWYLGSGQNGTVDGVFLCQDHTSGTYCRQEFALSLKSLISSRENLNII